MRYIVTYKVSGNMITYTAFDADTPDQAKAAFNARYPHLTFVSADEAPDNAAESFGAGARTEEENEVISARLEARYRAMSRARELATEELMSYTLDEFAAESAYISTLSEPAPNAHGCRVGDLLYCEWGYEQTNVNFYQITALKGKRTIEVCEVRQVRKDIGDMQGICRPVRDAFIGDNTYTLRTFDPEQRGGVANAPGHNGRHLLYKWDGRPRDWTAYA